VTVIPATEPGCHLFAFWEKELSNSHKDWAQAMKTLSAKRSSFSSRSFKGKWPRLPGSVPMTVLAWAGAILTPQISQDPVLPT